MNLVEALHPVRSRSDGREGRLKKVPVPPILRRIDNDGEAAIALDMRSPSGMEAIAQAKFDPQLACV